LVFDGIQNQEALMALVKELSAQSAQPPENEQPKAAHQGAHETDGEHPIQKIPQ
jgi:hypothetical protein